MVVDQENLQPGGEQTADSQIKQDTPHRQKRSLSLGLADLRTNPLARRFLWTSTRVLLTASILGTAITDFLSHSASEANADSTTAITATTSNPPKETMQAVEDTGVGVDYTDTYTDDLGNTVIWQTKTVTMGIPPNNPDDIISTDHIFVNDLGPISSQPNEALFPADTNQITIFGHKTDVSVNKAYRVVSITRNSLGDGKILPYIEILLDAKDVKDPSKRLLVTNLPQGGAFADNWSSLKLGSDSQGKYLQFSLKNSRNKSEDGTYMIRLDSSGLPIGVPVKIASVMSRRAFLSIVANQTSGG